MIRIDGIVSESERQAPELQPWKKYYERRGLEIELALDLAGQKPVRRALDVGCSNGFSMAVLSSVAEEVIGFDLPEFSMDTHSIGIAPAKEYLSRMNLSNRCRILGASAEAIPVADGTIDLVYAMYVLEHVPNRVQALREMRRVLAPGGHVIALVPSFFDRALAPIDYWRYLTRRLAARVGMTRDHDSNATPQTLQAAIPHEQKRTFGTLVRELFRKNPSFPLPPPHGEYSSWREELSRSTTTEWRRIFESAGLEIQSTFCSFLVPHTLLGAIHADLAMWLYRRTHDLHRRLGKIAAIKPFGACVGIVASRPS